MGRPVPVELAQLRIYRRDDLCLVKRGLQRSARVVNRVQETQNVTAQLPVLRGDRAPEQADRVAVHPVKLLETM